MLEKDERFNKILQQVDSPTYSQDLREQLFKGLEKVYRSPPHSQTSIILGREISPKETQNMLFFPTPQDMSFYPVLISSPPGYDPNYPSATVCFALFHLSVILRYNF